MLNEKMFLEDLLWTSYRYCIGRHSYVTSMAKDVGEFFYDRLSNETKQKNAEDIRRELNDCLDLQFNFKINYFSNIKFKPLETFLEFINSQDIKDGKDFANITKITPYKEDGQLKFEVSRKDITKNELPFYEHNILDFLPWMDLASLFDVNDHKRVYTTDGNCYECYESYSQLTKPAKKEKGTNFQYLENVPWKYKKIYRPVDKYVSSYFIDEDSITKVEDFNNKIINI